MPRAQSDRTRQTGRQATLLHLSTAIITAETEFEICRAVVHGVHETLRYHFVGLRPAVPPGVDAAIAKALAPAPADWFATARPTRAASCQP